MPRHQRIHRCPVCNALYPATFSTQIYCSGACRQRAKRLRLAGQPVPVGLARGGNGHASAAALREAAAAGPPSVAGILTVRDGATCWQPATVAIPDPETTGLHKSHNQEAPTLVFGEPIPIKDAPAPSTLRGAGLALPLVGEAPPHSDQAHESSDMSEVPSASSREKEKAVSGRQAAVGQPNRAATKSSGQHMVWRPYGGKMTPEQEDLLKGHFLRAYELTGCRKLNSCRQVHVEPRTVDRWQEEDPDFALRMMEVHLGLLEELRAVNIEAAKNPDKGFLSRITELKRLDPSYRERQWEIPVSGPVLINIVYKAQELPAGNVIEGEVKELSEGR